MALATLTILHLIAFTAGFTLTVGMLIWTWNNRNRSAATELFAVLVCVAIWNASALLQVFLGQPYLMLLTRVSALAKILMVVSWLYFGMTYAGYRHVLQQRSSRFILAEAIGWLLLVHSLPPGNGIIYLEPTVITDPFTELTHAGSSAANFSQSLTLIMAVIGTGAILYRLIRAGYTEAWQTQSFAIASAAPIVVEVFENGIFAAGVPGVDYVALVVPLSSLIYILTLYRYDLLGYHPVAKTDVIEVIDDPVVVLNPDHKIIDYNRAAQTVLFDDVDIALGTDAQHFLPRDMLEIDSIRNLEEGSEELTLTIDGRTRYYDMNTTPMEAAGDKQGLAIVMRDITELRERTQDFEQQTEQLDHFTRVVNHHLRNPLAVVEAYITDAQNDYDDDRLDTAAEELDRMETLIEDTLTLAREGRVIEETAPESLRETAREAWALADPDDATLDIHVPDSAEVLTDRRRFRRLFENLYRNAVTADEPDDLTIRVGLLEPVDTTAPTDGTVQSVPGFYVEYTGNGIPPEKRDRVFEQGYTPADDGTGFKLAIVKRIADAHNWDVNVTESTEGGARFEFYDAEVQGANTQN